MENFDEIRERLWTSFGVMKPADSGDLSDIGNEIGMILGQYTSRENTAEDFIRGLRHGISLSDGSHI
jgi:hypothetical protein